MDFRRQLAARIKAVRLEKGLKAKYVAARLKMHPTRYSLLEKGEVPITEERLFQLAEIFGIEIGYFFNNELSGSLSEVV